MSHVNAVSSAASSAVGAEAETIVLHLLLQLIVIFACTRVVVYLIRRVGQTDVSGEILAGLLLGPSLLGALAPQTMNSLFDPSMSQIFVGLAQVGLILLMFQIGMEFEFKGTLNASKRSIAVVSLAGIIVPAVLGFWSAPWFHAQLPEPRPALLGFQLFFAIAMSITAIPILGRIFMELNLSHTRTAALTIGAAAIDDAVGWLLLGVVTLIVQQEFSADWLLLRVGMLALYIAFIMFVARPFIKRAISSHLTRHGELQPSGLALILILLFVSAAITSLIGVFAIIGGFVIGAALHDDRAFVKQWKMQVAPLVNVFFLPIFFAYTGLRTDVGSLAGWHEWLVCLLVIGLAFVSKFGGAYIGARLVGESSKSAMAIGVCMNTRALMELIAINIGYDMGVLPRNVFTMLVIMALVSTYVATPLIRWLMRDEVRGSPERQDKVLPPRKQAHGAWKWGSGTYGLARRERSVVS